MCIGQLKKVMPKLVLACSGWVYWLQSRKKKEKVVKNKCIFILEKEIKPEMVYSLLTVTGFVWIIQKLRFKKRLFQEEPCVNKK